MRQISRLSLRDLLYLLCRDRWKIASVALAAIAVAGAWLFFLADTIYVAESRVLVRMGREKLTGIETLNRDNANFLFQERGQDINNTIELMRDPQFIYPVLDTLAAAMGPTPPPPEGVYKRIKYEVKRAVREVLDWVTAPLYWLGLRTRLPPTEAMANVLRSALHVEAMEDTDVIRVMFGWTDPEFAAQAANVAVEALLSRQVSVYGSDAPGKFYGEKLADQRIRVKEAEQALAAFRASRGITNLTLQKDMLLREIEEAETRRKEVVLRLGELRQLEVWLKNQNKSVRAGSGADDWPTTPELRGKLVLDVSALDNQYYELVGLRTQLGATKGAGSPELQQLTQRMAGLRVQKLESIASQIRAAAEADGRELASLGSRSKENRLRLEALNGVSSELGDLERAVETAEQSLLAFTRKTEDLRVADQLNDRQISGLRVMSAARPPAQPVAPRKGLVLGLALLLGLLLGLAYSALLEYFDHTFRGSDDVQNVLGLRLLMTVPQLDAGRGA